LSPSHFTTRLLVCLALATTACHRPEARQAPVSAPVAASPVTLAVAPEAKASRAAPPKDESAPPRRHAAPEKPLELCPTADALSGARSFYDEEKFEQALACSARACADSPDSPDAHSERAADLVALGRYDEAQLAFARALALDPDHLDALLGAADLYVTRLAGSRDNDELALVYAERGLKDARKGKQPDLVGSFALEGAMALNDLGRPAEALERADDALKHGAPEDDASYERASALYELCRFDEAAALFSHLVGVKEKQAYARYHLGLIAERKGDTATAARELSAARAIDGADFPAEVPISPKDFDAMIQRQVHALPPDMQQDLATLPLQIQDLPDLADLTANEPPLSPAILGLFRGPALQERCDGAEPGPCRSIVLYRKNLARVTRDPADLEDQVRVTLLHELGHLRGEDDLQLAARGLE
jgi:tetratricopeptide (TPR) repeat protein